MFYKCTLVLLFNQGKTNNKSYPHKKEMIISFFTGEPIERKWRNCTMSDQVNQTGTSKKKISLQEAIKQQLARKKNEASTSNNKRNPIQQTKMQSQQTKKTNNQRKRQVGGQ